MAVTLKPIPLKRYEITKNGRIGHRDAVEGNAQSEAGAERGVF